MKVHYNNILLFAFPLNILVHNQRNHKSITPHTPKIPTTRLLCECELYAPANYDNDPQMKSVMENFHKQTSERFKEYDERMQSKRMECKDKCDREIQKIILKDKIDKELTDKFATLQTDIQSEAIPTCICEKSLAVKTEKFCLNCGKIMEGVAPWWGFVCGVGYVGWSQYVAAKVLEESIKNGIKVGLDKVIEIVTPLFTNSVSVPKFNVIEIFSSGYFNENMSLLDIFKYINTTRYADFDTGDYSVFSWTVQHIVENPTLIKKHYSIKAAEVVTAVADGKIEALSAATPATNALINAIIASVVSIVVIVLVMVIIYLILRYRQKKKMTKKLRYIKLLKE
ncbi:rifin PIR protein, putative [Plasmodium reichenowi]|uniref:Rifin PIR protein, putative n=1 Tax=Plasmodium reichenowi TaxID=5854 RepID=A0A2P9DE81_PLARE|nr:rifin PIR protein, putative [Plasmodium reichenowi]